MYKHFQNISCITSQYENGQSESFPINMMLSEIRGHKMHCIANEFDQPCIWFYLYRNLIPSNFSGSSPFSRQVKSFEQKSAHVQDRISAQHIDKQ